MLSGRLKYSVKPNENARHIKQTLTCFRNLRGILKVPSQSSGCLGSSFSFSIVGSSFSSLDATFGVLDVPF